MRKIFGILFVLLPSLCFSQNITNADFRVVGNTIEITYSLSEYNTMQTPTIMYSSQIGEAWRKITF